jgi:3-hydroxyacyl-CoA dehydrogenase/enoyl-CoA hydratase/3-hydroxybutyryl-CoA epimerase
MTNLVTLSFSDDQRLAILSLGSPEERAITLTPGRIAAFVAALQQVASSKVIGLVVRAPTIESFCVGADISLIQGVTDPLRGAELATQGQRAFDLLEDLACTTVAAISGPCVGGGCELVLACDYRIMADTKNGAIGLPETKLGILPGFGGSYRLPRLIGLPAALDIILAGKTVKAQQAHKIGLVDAVVPVEKLHEYAAAVACGDRQPPRRRIPLGARLLTNNLIGRTITRWSARRTVMAQSKGKYPAPLRALEITTSGLSRGRTRALAREAVALGELIVTAESKALVNLFYLTEAAKGLGKGGQRGIEGSDALVIGAGVMGAGIAGSLARTGRHVTVKDTSEAALQRGRDHVAREFSKIHSLSHLERAAAATRIDWVQFPTPQLSRCGIVIEAVFEDIALKQRIFTDIASRVSSACILASNTSSLSVTEMARAVPNPERFVGMHFFNPVEKMPLVEIIRGEHTSDLTIATVAALATQLGKFPIVVQDVPGFLINRILIPYLNEATYLLQEGYSVAEIDAAALGFGMPMGPLRLLDEVGLDVAAHVSKIMVAGYGERMSAPPFAERLLALGRKGRKSSGGFYEYRGAQAQPWEGLTAALTLPTSPRTPRLSRAELTDRLILHIVNEALKCLSEGVAGVDRERAQKQIDLGTVMGIGFPPFRGGVLYYAQQRGLENIRKQLIALHNLHGCRYEMSAEHDKTI